MTDTETQQVGFSEGGPLLQHKEMLLYFLIVHSFQSIAQRNCANVKTQHVTTATSPLVENTAHSLREL